MTSIKCNREKTLAVITAIVIIGTLVFMIVIEPQLKMRKTRLANLRQLQLKLMKMKRDLLVKDRIDSRYSQIEPLIVSHGTDQQEISLLTRELRDLYLKLNVNTRTIKILPVTNEEFYKRLSVRIEMSGHIKEILKFIYSVEAHANPIRIEQFGIKAKEITDNVQASFLITKVVAEPEV
jgi:Tfp pilus assembly protein PilO